MKKQTRTLLILLAAVVVLVGAYAGIRLGLKAKAKREAEEAAQAVVHVGELEDLQEVTYQNPYGVFRFTRQDDGQWVYAEDPELPIDPQNLEDIAEAVVGLTAVYEVEPEDDLSYYGLDGTKTFSATDSQGRTLDLILGKQCPDGATYYAMLSDGSACYTIPDALDRCVRKALTEMILLPEMPKLTRESLLSLKVEGRLGTFLLDRDGDEWFVTLDDGERTPLMDFEVPVRLTAFSSNDKYLDSLLDDDYTYFRIRSAAFYPIADADLSDFGLETPKYVITLVYDLGEGIQTLVLSVGKYSALEDANGRQISDTALQRYAVLGGDDIIYTILEDDYERTERMYFEFFGHEMSEEPVGQAANED